MELTHSLTHSLTQLKPISVRHPKTDKIQGFTLAELLISLAILGVIATFTIPKILSAQQASANNAKAKEVAAMISQAYQQAQLDGIVAVGFKASDLTPYMNYLANDTTSFIDGAGNMPGVHFCSPTYPCVRLHNGGLLLFQNNCAFTSTTPQTFTQFWFDPDGQALGPVGADGPSKSVMFDIYYNGFLTTRDKLKAGSNATCGTFGPDSGYDPSWFNWN